MISYALIKHESVHPQDMGTTTSTVSLAMYVLLKTNKQTKTSIVFWPYVIFRNELHQFSDDLTSIFGVRATMKLECFNECGVTHP